MKFKLKNTDQKARRGTLTFERGAVETPAFMPVGTYGTVKAMTPEEVEEIGAQIILGNTFHLAITPGTDVIKAHGDLHDFMHWQGPILTDSGGFQVFSLGDMRKISEAGVDFRSPKDGAKIFMGSEESIKIQFDLVIHSVNLHTYHLAQCQTMHSYYPMLDVHLWSVVPNAKTTA
jgi:queuine tRNA-ribosyltransferase